MTRATSVLLASITSIALLAGCGGSDDDAIDTTVTAPELATPDGGTTEDTGVDETTGPVDTSATDGTSVAGDEASFVQAFGSYYGIFDDDDEANTCVGQTFVDFIGLDQLESAGTTPDDVVGIITLDDLGVTVSQDDLPAAVDQLSDCGDLVTVSLDSASATPEQTACAAEIVTNDLAAEQLLVQVSGLEPSDDLLAARDGLQACAAE